MSELRARGGDKPGITGHAAVFNSLSEDLGGWKETILPGAFSDSIKRDDIRALWNHDANYVLGRNRSGTLRLSEDSVGLAIENDFPDTIYARDLVKIIDRGDVSQMSFGFYTLRDNWRIEGGLVIRELIEAQLFDVSPVTYPAYPQTDVAMRSVFQTKIAELQRENKSRNQSNADFAERMKQRNEFLNRRAPQLPTNSLAAILRNAKRLTQ